MATLSSVKHRAETVMGPLFFFFLLILLSIVIGQLSWLFTQNALLSILVGVAAAAVFSVWWFLYQWQTNVTWLCRIQMIFFGAGALSTDYVFVDDALPWTVKKRTAEAIKTAADIIKGASKNLVENRHVLDKYLGSHASRQVRRNPFEVGGESQDQQDVIILFSDIRGFTAMTEKLTSKETMRVLNHIYSLLGTTLASHGGEINKFIGDAILAYFKRSGTNPRADAEKVVKAALEMQEKFAAAVRRNNDLNIRMVKIGLGIGIASGKAIMANLGSENRMEFSVIGDTVNTASLLCGLAYEGEVLINEDLALLVTDKYHMESRMPVQLKDKKESTTPYCVFGSMENRASIKHPTAAQEENPLTFKED
jgi:class 3 adenylate cyclase